MRARKPSRPPRRPGNRPAWARSETSVAGLDGYLGGSRYGMALEPVVQCAPEPPTRGGRDVSFPSLLTLLVRERKAAHPRTRPAFAEARLLCLLALMAPLALASPAAAVDVPSRGAMYENGPSGRHLLDGDWHERTDPRGSGVREGFQRSASLAGWTPTTVPDAANAGDFSEQSYLGSVHWYRKDFLRPTTTPRSRWILRFESVNYRATVWLNGRAIGRHTGAYLPFEVDAGKLKEGVNRLVVRVDSRRALTDVPSLAVRRDGRFVGGWWNYTGILREVYLRPVDVLDLRNVFVRPSLPCRTCAATLAIDALIQNMTGRAAVGTLEVRVGGHVDEPAPRRVGPRRAGRVRASVRIEKPELWSPENPHLYPVKLRLRDETGRLLQTYDVRAGIRSYEVKRGLLLLNGRPVSLRGASLHEDTPDRGAALTASDIRQSFSLLRELGATMTRAHYPMHPLALELADRYGILVWSEIPVYQMEDRLFRNDGVRRQSVRMLREMVLRDRNHPSVVVWSVGNENTTRPGPGFRRYVRQAKRAVRRLDPTRLVGVAFPGYPNVGRVSLYGNLDALGMNDYFGWYPGPADTISRREDLGPYLDRLHEEYPRQALFVTEFGAEANRSGLVGVKGTFDFQRDFLAYHLDAFAARPFVNAALVWILRDFRVKPGYDGGNPEPSPPLNTKGLVDDAGNRKPSFDLVRQKLEELRAAGR